MMPNMSYCRFEHTLEDFIDCYESLNGTPPEELSNSEFNSFLQLLQEAADFVDEFKDYLEDRL